MTLLPRKVTFQLTPLLDLLLIVIFAQYLEMRSESSKEKESNAKIAAEKANSLETAQGERDHWKHELEDSDHRLKDRDRTIELLQDSLAKEDARQKRLTAQRNLMAQQLARLFAIPEKQLAKAFKPLFAQDAARRAAELKKLQARIEKLKRNEPDRVLRHVVKYEELLKRCDIWELHIDGKNIVRARIGRKDHEFRIRGREPRKTKDAKKYVQESARYRREMQQDFERKLFTWYKTLPQPKNTVIILVSRDAKIEDAAVTAARFGIPKVGDRIAAESGSRIQVVPVELGAIVLRPFPKEKTD